MPLPTPLTLRSQRMDHSREAWLWVASACLVVGVAFLGISAALVAAKPSTSHAHWATTWEAYTGYGLFVAGGVCFVAGIKGAWFPLMGQSHPSIEAPRPRTPAGGGSSATAQTALPDPSVVAAEPTTDSPAAREIVDVTPEYLAEFFRDRTSIQADKLAAAYLGKWMKVSGPLGNIGGITTFSQVTFAFNTFGSLSVYLLFRDGDVVENRVSTLSQGDQITVLGQIDRIDAVSLQLGNCGLIDAVATAPTRQVVFDDAPPELADTSPASLMELFAGRTEAQAATLLKQQSRSGHEHNGEVAEHVGCEWGSGRRAP